ncbi:MAG: dihydroneopterin aldolase [Candidatus Omnitrophica bacterium]|nr:dihydroneopterin aldolase [Candidatus Omnitrophota bacterium]
MADRLLIHELEARCRLGVYEREQAAPQRILIDLELTIDAARAAAGDDVRQAIDYAQLVGRVKQLAEGSAYRLMETLAEAIAADVLERFEVPALRVRVKKQALPGIGYAAVEVERARRTARAGRRRPRAAAGRYVA